MESSDQPEFSCAICYEDFNSVEQKLQMPCCGKQESTVQFCRRCIEIISERGIQGRIGRCPGCSTYFSFLNGEVVPASEHYEQCQLCRQMKSIADLGRMLCDQCLLGSSFCFRYECSRCHGLQRIPHPMWKYQVDAISFGTNSWACHLGCHDYTMWRVISEDAVQIPPEHCPETWGRRDEWIASIRCQRQLEMQSGIRRGSNAGQGRMIDMRWVFLLFVLLWGINTLWNAS